MRSGKVLVHNLRAVRPHQQSGLHGFRFWLAEPSDRWARCDCHWAPELPEHYRTKRRP